MSAKYEQLTIPEVDQACREIRWFTGVPTEKRRWFGRKVVGYETLKQEGGVLSASTSMRSSELAKIHDLDLRLTLELADAAESMDDYIDVVATDEGLDSRLLYVSFYSKAKNGVDPFMERLRCAAPGHE
jgi:hypothetical protein